MKGKRKFLDKVEKRDDLDKKDTSANRNYVAKNMSGAGAVSKAHEAKVGDKAKRARQNRNWKKEAGY